ncbi:probable Werner syndrome ATP-dependent helicase homolog 1 isoform X2 [Patiria miniata]|uniref:DNA 3'-5' helicase n=1 Tax=Patiria miniata TaxID=46514 RepID=A0A913ZQB7_PATMI|nr:probable Werner syndrome ATP-dependent helicase homolog 1 isoform X2 [Patiria miniata]
MKYEEKAAIMQKGASLVFASPEALLDDDQPWRQLLRTYRKHVCLLAFDEGHCIAQEGEPDSGIYNYNYVEELRGILTDVPTLVMTATLPAEQRSNVLKILHLNPKDTTTVAQNPDRPNVFLKFVERNKPGQEGGNVPKWLQDYVEELQQQGTKAPKAIMYCRHINTVTRIWGYMMASLGQRAWVTPGSKKPSDLIVEMYQCGMTMGCQERVVDRFTIDSNLRCIVATMPFAMGIEVPDVRYILHWGLSSNITDYWQEIGKCAVDGKPGVALLYPAPSIGHTPTSSQTFKQLVLDIQDGKVTCMRAAFLSQLWLPEMGVQPVRSDANCDGLCAGQCRCNKCVCCSLCQSSCPCRK